MGETVPEIPFLTELRVPPPITKDDWEYEPRLAITMDALDMKLVQVNEQAVEEHSEGES